MTQSQSFIIHCISQYSKVSEYLAAQSHSKVICFKGELGAGKTCLIQNFCKYLNCDTTASSPTFSLVNEYLYEQGVVFHFDLYRLESAEEAFDMGIEEYLYSGNYCLIEWPEIIEDVFLENYLEVKIEVQPDISRKVLISTK